MKKVPAIVAATAAVVLGFLALSTAASAGTVTFVPDVTPGIGAAINSDGFFISADTYGYSLYGASATAGDGHLYASGAGYSDAGLVLYLNGGLTLGQLSGVSVASTGAPLAVNLWLDTGGDGKFFTVDPSNGLFAGLNGDSYAGCGVPSISNARGCYMLGGDGAGGTYSLAQLQAGVVSGIGGSTPVALWIGITNPGGSTLSADISNITVTTASAVPDGGSTLLLLGLGFTGLGLLRRRIR